MADIDVVKKQGGGMGWLWAVLALVVIVLLAWWLWPGDETRLDDPARMGTEAPGDPDPTASEEAGLAGIVANPSIWVGRPLPQMEATAGDRMTDRAFFIQADGAELLAVMSHEPQEQATPITHGQQLRITGGTLRGPEYVEQIEGSPLPAETRALVQEQEIYLVVNRSNIIVLEERGQQTPPGVRGNSSG